MGCRKQRKNLRKRRRWRWLLQSWYQNPPQKEKNCLLFQLRFLRHHCRLPHRPQVNHQRRSWQKVNLLSVLSVSTVRRQSQRDHDAELGSSVGRLQQHQLHAQVPKPQKLYQRNTPVSSGTQGQTFPTEHCLHLVWFPWTELFEAEPFPELVRDGQLEANFCANLLGEEWEDREEFLQNWAEAGKRWFGDEIWVFQA